VRRSAPIADVHGAAGAVERVVLAAALSVQVLLDAAPAPVERVAVEADDVGGVHHRRRCRRLFGGGGLESGEPVHRDDLQPVAPGLRPVREPHRDRQLGAAFDHCQQPRRAGPVPDRRQVDDDRDELVAAAGVPPHVLIDADDPDPVEASRVVEQDALPLGEHGGVGGATTPRGPRRDARR
jgi:hypothetical protein